MHVGSMFVAEIQQKLCWDYFFFESGSCTNFSKQRGHAEHLEVKKSCVASNRDSY